jgi:copper chaperone
VTTSELFVAGMHCGGCVSSVTEELSAIEGVRGVNVALNASGASTVTVESDAPLDDLDVRAAIVEAGYKLVPTP